MKETLIRIFKKIYASFFFIIFRCIPIQNKVVFSSFSGKRYGDNPKIISQKLYEEHQEIGQVWLYKNNKFEDVPQNIIQKKWSSIGMIYELATAKVWVDSHTKPEWVLKRKKQFFIETWHGGLGMKKIEGDAKDKLPTKIVNRIKHNSKMTDVLISNSDWLTEIYKRAFFYNGRIEKIGYPKNDYLLNLPKGIKEKVYKYYNFDSECKFLLYTPTMRENPKKEIFAIDAINVIKELEEKYNGKWKILIRLHPVNENFISEIKFNENIINATDYPDILELIVASEVLLTDYSSCIFDAALIKKKSMIFTLDEEEYIKERGLYVNLDDLPFLIARNNEELLKNIKKFDNEKYEQKVKEYFNKVGLLEDGKSTEKIIKMIMNEMEEKYEYSGNFCKWKRY